MILFWQQKSIQKTAGVTELARTREIKRTVCWVAQTAVTPDPRVVLNKCCYVTGDL